MKRMLVIGLSVLFAAFLAGCGPQAVYLVSPPTTTTVPTTTTTTVPPTTTTTIALEITPTVTCPANYSWNGSDCGGIGVACANGQPPISGSLSNGTATCGGNGEMATEPNVPATITCPEGYSLQDSQATGYYQECVLS